MPESIDEISREDIKVVSMDPLQQTGIMSKATLPLQYPENLIHAQRMYALCLGQLLTVEQQISQLQSHLRERQMQSSTAAAAVLAAAVSLQAKAGKASDVAQIHVEGDPRQVVGGMQAQADGQEAVREGAPLPQGQPLRQHRQRLQNAVKIAFVMLLLEFSTGWFFVYFFGVVFYIGGMFDPVIDWFQRRPARVGLEQQLNGLRNRQRRGEERIAEQSDAERAASADQQQQTTDDVESKEESIAELSDSTTANASSSESQGVVSGDLQNSSEETPPVAERFAQEPANENIQNANQPPYWHRFIYQLFVMFFLTLLPWWNPDPRYAETQNM